MTRAVALLKPFGRRLVDGFWLVPAGVGLAYAALALALLELDRTSGQDGIDAGFGGDADASREILSTIAGSLITVAGVAFSLTIVVLVLVSSQFSPRALPGFLADRLNQVVAGSFVGIFAYCLIVLSAVRDATASQTGFVPAMSVTVAIVLALGALALLVVFVHHMGRSIQASEISARLGAETLAAIDRLHPDRYRPPGADARGDETVRIWRAARAPQQAFPRRAGYVQRISSDSLLGPIARPGVRLHVAVCAGDFVTERTPLVEVWSAEPLDEELLVGLGSAVPIASERHLGDDAAYGIRQLADVAVKALSPGINDPTTAATCIGHLRSVMERLAERALPAELEVLADGDAVAVVRVRSWDEYAEHAFAEIGRYATDDARIVRDVLEALGGVAAVAAAAGADERLLVLGDLARDVAEPALAASRSSREKAAIAERLEDVARLVAPR